MASVMTAERLAGSRALMTRLRELKSRGRRPSQSDALWRGPVVLALESEPMKDVVQRMHSYEPPVLLAVYYPQTERLVLAEVGVVTRQPGAVAIGRDTTVGMVLDTHDSLHLPQSWETIKVTQLADA